MPKAELAKLGLHEIAAEPTEIEDSSRAESANLMASPSKDSYFSFRKRLCPLALAGQAKLSSCFLFIRG